MPNSSIRIAALLLLGPLLSARADEGANVWLDRFAHSAGALSYRGVLTYERGDHTESLRVTHGSVNGEEYERLEHLDGDQREVIRRGEQLTCIYLGQRIGRLFQRDQLLKTGLAGLEPYYEARTAGESRVAGRRAMAITLQPKDEYRFGYRLALDYDTGLLLRSELVGADGRVLERFQFVDLQVQPLKQEWIADASAPAAAAAPAPAAASTAAVDASTWSPQWLPPGFVLAMAPRQAREDMLTYSDGLAVMSVFVEPASGPLPSAEGRARQGATVAYTRSLRHKERAYIVTVVGEVPQSTAERVANSVGWRAQP